MSVLTVLVLCRFLRDVCGLLLWGGAVYVMALAPAPLRDALRASSVRLCAIAIFVLALALVALLPAEAAALGTGWGDALDPAMLRGLLFETTIGTAWMAQAGAACLLVVATRLPDGAPLWATAATSAGLLAAGTLTGHAAMHEGAIGLAQRIITWLHLLAGGFWLGALPPLLPTLRLAGQRHLHPAAVIALRRFSALGHGAVALVIATGLANAALILGHWPASWASPYAALLAAKAGIVAIMTVLAIANRYLFVPQLPWDLAGATTRIRRTTIVEVALGLVAVMLVALFSLLEPA